jgi:hypothetical protein
MQPTIEIRAERLLGALAGVVSARAVADETGRLCEIHILAAADLHPKQIVRNVESALSAGLGVVVDRRIISVAQLRQDAAIPPVEKTRKIGREREARIVYDKFEAASTSSLDTRCTVVLRRGDDTIIGEASGLNTTLGRADAAARAVFEALQSHGEVVGLEGTTLVESHGRPFVLVSARAGTGRSSHVLTGVAVLQRSPEEAAIFASLQATNRIATLDG